MSYKTRPVKMMIHREADGILSEMSTFIEVADEGAGEFLVIFQENNHSEKGKVGIEAEEWPVIRDTIEKMLKECRK